jgi:hypothetical protein
MTKEEAIRAIHDMFLGLPDDYWPDMEDKAHEFLFNNGFENESERAKIIDLGQ